MPDFKLPLSGDVTQTIMPWAAFFNPVGSQIGLFNINLGRSSNPAVEDQVLSDVASYGKQLGRIGDVLVVLLAHFRPERPLTHLEEKSIHDLGRMLEDIADVKHRHTSIAAGQSGRGNKRAGDQSGATRGRQGSQMLGSATAQAMNI